MWWGGRWKVEVGEGYATPLVVGSTVYSFTRRDGNEVMMALNAADGKIVWQTIYAAPYKMADPTKAHGQRRMVKEFMRLSGSNTSEARPGAPGSRWKDHGLFAIRLMKGTARRFLFPDDYAIKMDAGPPSISRST